GRSRPTVHLVPADQSGVRRMLLALRRGGAGGLLPDQVPGKGGGGGAEVFGRPADTLTVAMRPAERDNVARCPLYWRRLPRGPASALIVRPLPEPLPGETATRRMNRGIEMLIRDCPGQYLWSYNRYKSLPG